MLSNYSKLVALLLCFMEFTVAIKVDWKSTKSVKKAASTMAYDMMTFYKGNLTGNIPGVLGPPYYWWEAGAMFGALINYWAMTGDSTYNEVTMQGMQYQVGEFKDYMPQDHRSELGNDDQAFWAIAAMQAVETNFPDPPPDKPSWLGLVQAVFNEQVGRWDNSTCGGGLRWQIYMKGGYNLKNSISNACLFNIAARLARYTGDEKYAYWAKKIWDWMWDIGLITEWYDVYDNAEADLLNCTDINKLQWSYNPAVLLLGTATMYNYTNGSTTWGNRTEKLLGRIDDIFFPNSTATELCELYVVCDEDQKSFKAYLARWMAATTQFAPFTYPKIKPLILNSAKMAADQCIGGDSGTKCGLQWWRNGTWDGTNGVGEQMAALEFTIGTLVPAPANGTDVDEDGHIIKPPVTGNTGGTSKPDPDAGHDTKAGPLTDITPATKGDRIGAWFLTVVILLCCLGATWFMISEALEDEDTKAESKKVRDSTRESVVKERESVVLDLKGKSRVVSGDSSVFSVWGGIVAESTPGLEPIDEEKKAREKEESMQIPIYKGGEKVT